MNNVNRQYYHYIYKIIFLKGLPERRYYLGKRTFYGLSIETDKYIGSGNFCFRYFKKYGIKENETYIKEILEVNPDQNINRDREKFWVGDLWKTDPLCMNQCPGGAGSADHKTLVECQNNGKKYINQYDLDGNFIKTWFGIKVAARALHAQKSGINACIHGRKPTAFGFQWRLYEGSTSNIEKYTPGIMVDRYSLDGIYINTYPTIMDAARAVNLEKHSNFISECCKNKRKSTRNCIWRFYEEELTPEHINWVNERKEVDTKTSPICQYTRDGNFIEQYKNIADASRKTGINDSSISACILKKRKTAGNFVWRKKEDEFTENDCTFNGVAIAQYDLNGNFIKTYNTIPEAALQFENPASAKSGINSCCRRHANSSFGYIWRYLNDNVTKEDLEKLNNVNFHPNIKKVIHYDIDGITILKEYLSIKDALKDVAVHERTLRGYCEGKHFPKDKTIWKYKED